MARRLALGSAVALLAVPAVAAPAAAKQPWTKAVRAYPGLHIPRVFVTADDPKTSPGFVFLTPRARLGQHTGPTILDAAGHVVWFHRLSSRRTAINLQPQLYRGRAVLTWGQRPPLAREGDLYTGNPHTVYNLIADSRYRIIARVRAHGRGINTDLHEFEITRRNTALVLGFRIVVRNLTRYGGPRRSAVLDNVVQEVDIRSGRVLFSWSAARRLSPRDSMVRPPKTGAWDAYHVNAVSEDSDGNLLLTARHTSTVYKVDRHDGHMIWRLGGRHSSFRLSPSARFYYPHDAARAPDGTLTIFDNRATAVDARGRASRGLRLRLDRKRRRATLAGAFNHPGGAVLSTSQGNTRMLGDGNVFVGWGSSPWFSEYAADGQLLFAGHFQSQWNQSYRAFKGDWVGRPSGRPAVAALAHRGSVAVYASWNGATQVAQWRVLGGATAAGLVPLGAGPWQDFETKLSFPGSPAFVKVQALDAAGGVIGESAVVKPR